MVGTLQKPKIIRPRSCQVLLARINHRTRELRGLVAARSNIPFQVASRSLTEAARAAKASGSFPPVKPSLHSVTFALFSAERLSRDHLQLPFSRLPTDSLHSEVPNTLFWVQWALQGAIISGFRKEPQQQSDIGCLGQGLEHWAFRLGEWQGRPAPVRRAKWFLLLGSELAVRTSSASLWLAHYGC